MFKNCHLTPTLCGSSGISENRPTISGGCDVSLLAYFAILRPVLMIPFIRSYPASVFLKKKTQADDQCRSFCYLQTN